MLLVLLSVAVATAAGAAQASTKLFEWNALQKQGRVVAGTVLDPEPSARGHRLRIESSTPGPSSVTVLTIDKPQVSGPRYQVSGQVRYDGVEGVGYLEMWNHFPGGGQYFSRTLAEQGPMMKLQGTSGWRDFVLPFDASGAPPPTRLVINVVFAGRGVVYLGPLKLSDSGATDAIWPDGASRNYLASVAGAGGAIIGCIGALIGVLASLGRARRFVIGAATLLIVLGALSFVAGLAGYAWLPRYSVSYPLLLLLGFVTSVVPLGLLPAIRKRYEQIELRAMRAHDLR